MTQHSYRIEANGVCMGVFSAPNEDHALEVYALEAGYPSFTDLADCLKKSVKEARAELVVVEVSCACLVTVDEEDAGGWMITVNVSTSSGAVQSGCIMFDRFNRFMGLRYAVRRAFAEAIGECILNRFDVDVASLRKLELAMPEGIDKLSAKLVPGSQIHHLVDWSVPLNSKPERVGYYGVTVD